MCSHRPLRFAPVFCVLALWSSIASAQSYGPGDQVLTIGPAEFAPQGSGITYSFGGTDSYLYGGGSTYVAPLRLPDGAEITLMCGYFFDPDGGGNGAFIQAVKLP